MWEITRRWFPGEPNHHTGYFEELARLMPDSGKVLDLGCGANLDLARFRTPRREVWGTDLTPHPQLSDRAWFRPMNADGTTPFAPETFDLVACNMVLEHVADPRAFLLEVARVLKPGGIFVGHSISGTHYVTWCRRAFGLLPHAWNQWLVRKLYGRDECDTFPAYYRLSTPRRIARLGTPLGLRLVEVNRYPSQGYFEFSRPLFRAAVAADWLCDRLLPGMGRIYFSAILRKQAADEGRAPIASGQERALRECMRRAA